VDIGIAHASDQKGHFLLRLSMGFGALFSSKADRELKDRMGRLAYLLSALRALQESEITRYRISVDGHPIEAEGRMCAVANAGTIGIRGLSLAPDIHIDDGILDVFVISRADVETLAAIVSSIMGGGRQEPALKHWRGKQIEVASEPVQRVEGDGERVGRTPAQVSVLHHGLDVVVPSQGPGSE
jgi:diacylglycerol kinase family enzyme